MPLNLRSPSLNERIDSLQYLRAFAALLVVLYHSLHMATAVFPGIDGDALKFGAKGVDVFFVLSGFIVLYVTEGDGRTGEFLKRRAQRILPVYWAALAFYVLFYMIVSAMTGRTYLTSIEQVVTGIFLWGPEFSTAPVIVGVAWTLRFEFVLYVSLALAMLVTHRYRAQLAATMILLVTASLQYYSGKSQVLSQMAAWSGAFYGFPLGMAIYYIWRENPLFAARETLSTTRSSLLAIAVAVISGAFLYQFSTSGWLYPRRYSWQYGGSLPAAFVFVSWLFIFGRWRLTGPVHQVMTFFGNASFTLYLVHMAGLSALTVIPGIGTIGLTGYVLFSIALSLAMGAAFYQLSERPILDYFRRRRQSARLSAVA